MSHAPRIELHPVNQRVQVHVDGTLLADSTNPLELRERGYPPRHYLPRDDVRMDLLTISETKTYCPFKGHTVYFSLDGNKDIAWSYEQSIEGMEAIKNRVVFSGKVAGVRVLLLMYLVTNFLLKEKNVLVRECCMLLNVSF
ncbi:Uncharacterized conserved protein, DUF427 family [Vreelandella subterranea]|uniref:Uncharacterized conserved protein, DUF427 family n=1 Tax=Vreelandella subterranea TaxID=416874 RepID=A0A1H9SZS7_9GAMM|nr:DUF427 domain-containing protein [Halomonas subterranea]SER90522.1 Uncharacterized conserved protein, DUF427 family [Halomonas subterranea]